MFTHISRLPPPNPTHSSTYKRGDQGRWMMPLYTPGVIENSSHNSQPAERAHKRPECTEYTPDILTILFPVPEEPRYRSWKLVQWRWRHNAVEIVVDIQVPVSGTRKHARRHPRSRAILPIRSRDSEKEKKIDPNKNSLQIAPSETQRTTTTTTEDSSWKESRPQEQVNRKART